MRPCAVELSTPDGADAVTDRYRVDQAGRLVEIVIDDVRTACTWRGERLAECVSFDLIERAIRDASGAITAIEDNTGRHEVVRDGGRIVAYGGAVVSYRDDGRIVTAGRKTIEYDAVGRIVAVFDGQRDEAWAYDDRGRLHTIATRRSAGDDELATYEYDDRGRLRTVLSVPRHERGGVLMRYFYDCDEQGAPVW